MELHANKPDPHLGVRRFARIRRGERLMARALFCLLAAVYLLVATGLPDHNDSETEFQTTSALGRGGTFALFLFVGLGMLGVAVMLFALISALLGVSI